jgi:hypothetical protein
MYEQLYNNEKYFFILKLVGVRLTILNIGKLQCIHRLLPWRGKQKYLKMYP